MCLKVIKNNKDFFDQSLDEIKLLQRIKEGGDPVRFAAEVQRKQAGKRRESFLLRTRWDPSVLEWTSCMRMSVL